VIVRGSTIDSKLSVGDGRRRVLVALLGFLLLLAASCRSPAEMPPDVPVGTEIDMLAPSLTGKSLDGAEFSLDRRRKEPVVLVFYRSASCGLCRVQLAELERHLPSYRELGVRPVAVTLDSPETGREMLEGTPGFDIVSVDTATFESWGALDPESGVPLPLTYILDANGIIRFRYRGRNASDRVRDAELLTVLQTLDLGR
jgi:peroxiredoxin